MINTIYCIAAYITLKESHKKTTIYAYCVIFVGKKDSRDVTLRKHYRLDIKKIY